MFVTLIGATETIGDSIAIQRVAWRKPRAVDFRAVQGAVAADGAGNLLSGLAGTVPNTTYSTSIAITELTGVAARSVGVWIGIVFAAAAFLPKVSALLLAIPSPMAAAYVTVLLSLLFVLGMRIVVQGGVDYRKATIAGTAFWIGVGFQNQVIFADHLGEWWGALLGNGMTAGASYFPSASATSASLYRSLLAQLKLIAGLPSLGAASAPRFGRYVHTLHRSTPPRPVDGDTRSSSRAWALRFRERPRSNGGGAYPWMRFMKASKRGTVNAAYPYRGL